MGSKRRGWGVPTGRRQPGTRPLVATALGLLLCLAAACGRCWGVTQEQLSKVLEDRGIALDTNAVQELVVTLTLGAVDPRARILSSGEAEAIGRRSSIEKAEEWPEGILYVKVRGLYDGGGGEIAERLQAWSGTNRTGVVLDLRRAQGDSLAAVDEIAGLVVPTNTPLYTVNDASNQVVDVHHPLQGDRSLVVGPLILLVDGETADASELLAAVLKERKGALLIGWSTRGDAGVRELIPVSDEEVLYIATRWVVPVHGIRYDAAGVAPDVPLSSTSTVRRVSPPPAAYTGRPLSEKAEMDVALMKRVGDDAALCRAADILFALKALGVRHVPAGTSSNAAALRQEESALPDEPAAMDK